MMHFGTEVQAFSFVNKSVNFINTATPTQSVQRALGATNYQHKNN